MLKLNRSDIQTRLYQAIAIAGACLSVVCIIGNYLAAFPFRPSIKWFVLFFVSTAALLLSRQERYRAHMMFAVFVFLVFLFLPFAFMDSGGSSNNAIGYTFFLLICITYLFFGWRRIFLVLGLVAIFMVLHAVEYFRPDLIQVYTGWSQFVDRMIQIPLLLLASFFIILQFAREYERVNAKLDEYATIDALTGLRNRRGFNQAMEAAASDRRNPVFLVLIDVDNFKKVNDFHGHSAGDKVLQKLAGLLQESFGRGRNTVSRWGGDEFAVIYYGDKKELTRCLKEIKESFQNYISPYNEDEDISFSSAAIQVQESGPVDQMLTRADHALYREKQKKYIFSDSALRAGPDG